MARIAPYTLANDMHSKLNRTEIAEVQTPESLDQLVAILARLRSRRASLSVAGGRHAMGGQQFLTKGALVDMRRLNHVSKFDSVNGLVTAEAGIQWPELVASLHALQAPNSAQWTIAQKQTGADRFSIGGSLASNIHGRGLSMQPLVNDIESINVVTADGELLECSRTKNAELFGLVIGGYGLFGIAYAVTVRLARRHKVRRVVTMEHIDTLAGAFERRIAEGFEYGDFQYSTDETSGRFMREGILSCYQPVADDEPIPDDQSALMESDWRGLIALAHVDKAQAYQRYVRHYLSSSGQVYWSDEHQLSTYIDDYHAELDLRTHAACPGSEMITELFLPRERLAEFMSLARAAMLAAQSSVIYGTIRLVKAESDTFLRWATRDWACVIVNLHVDHSPEGLAKSEAAFRALIDCAIACSGTYYLTYHRYATRAQLERCHPMFEDFLALKRRYDPDGLFQSDWYRHYAAKFA